MNTKHAITAALAIQTAEDKVHRALLKAILRHIGLQEIDGVPIPRWIETRRATELEKVLLAMGDMSPAAHDAVQACIAEAVKRSRAA